jgi:uncharacterized membrane protein
MSISGSAARENSLETRIGLYWLHRLGIVSLVLGFVFLMMYSFQYIGPVFKLLTGLGASAALITTGELMARKNPSKWFGHGLTAGGWSLAYFTAYAAHFLPSVAVITSMPVETALLIAVAAGSFSSALRANSELMSIFSITLAAASILFSSPGLFGNISFLVIAISASILANRKSWTTLFAWSMVACYAGHIYCSTASYFSENRLVTLYLSALWLTFAVGGGYATGTVGKANKAMSVLSCINAWVFAVGLSYHGAGMGPRNAMILAAAGTLYLTMTRWLLCNKHEQSGTIHSLLGLALINCAKTMHFSGTSLPTLDIIQIAVLAIAGLKYDIKSFRWVAALLVCTLIPHWVGCNINEDLVMSGDRPVTFGFHHFEYTKIAIFATSILAALAFFCREYGSRCLCALESVTNYGRFFTVTANIMFGLVVMNVAQPAWQSFAFAMQAAANHILFSKHRGRLHLVLGIIAFIVSIDYAAQFQWLWQTLPLTLVIGIFYGMHRHLAMHQDDPGQDQRNVINLKHIYSVAATVLLTTLLYEKMPGTYLSLSLGIEGLLLISAGFITRDGLFRICGLSVMALLTSKLLLVDMAHYNTFGRIVSFIGAGFVFLMASYAYAWFTRAFEPAVAGETVESEEAEQDDVITQSQPGIDGQQSQSGNAGQQSQSGNAGQTAQPRNDGQTEQSWSGFPFFQDNERAAW